MLNLSQEFATFAIEQCDDIALFKPQYACCVMSGVDRQFNHMISLHRFGAIKTGEHFGAGGRQLMMCS